MIDFNDLGEDFLDPMDGLFQDLALEQWKEEQRRKELEGEQGVDTDEKEDMERSYKTTGKTLPTDKPTVARRTPRSKEHVQNLIDDQLREDMMP
jgi:hypothetical protein